MPTRLAKHQLADVDVQPTRPSSAHAPTQATAATTQAAAAGDELRLVRPCGPDAPLQDVVMSQLDEGELAPDHCPRGEGQSTDDGCRTAPAVVAGSLEQAACALAAGAADEAIAPNSSRRGLLQRPANRRQPGLPLWRRCAG